MSENNWRYDLFDCFSAPKACLWASCVPFGIACLQATSIKLLKHHEDAYVKAFMCSILCCCIGDALNSKKIRKHLRIKGEFWKDALESYCCPCCSAVVEWREVMTSQGLSDDESICAAFSQRQTIP